MAIKDWKKRLWNVWINEKKKTVLRIEEYHLFRKFGKKYMIYIVVRHKKLILAINETKKQALKHAKDYMRKY